MSAPTYTLRAWRSWSDVEAGRRAVDREYTGPGARERALADADALPYPVADVIRHDPALDGRGGGRVIADRREPYPR